jgi:hypothetical protein
MRKLICGGKDMKIKIRTGCLLLTFLVVSILAAYFFGSNMGGKSELTAEVGAAYALVYPAFAQSLVSESSFLDKEAGIALYLSAGRTIDLSKAKAAYRSIEKEDANYTIGSIALPNLPEGDDVHCFVHREGWIVVYYLKGEPVAKIIDWNYWSGGQLASNKLQVGLEKMCNALGLPTVGAKYYHFQYPLANKLMLVIDAMTGAGEDSFRITIPKEIAVYEASWSHYDEKTGDYYSSYFLIDGKLINEIHRATRWTAYGFLSGQLSPDVTHVVSISTSSEYAAFALRGVCIALVYREP